MTQLDLPKVIKVLEKDVELVKEKQKFADLLGIPSSNVHQLNQQFIAGIITVYVFFHNVLGTWVSQEGNNATISALAKILEDNGFKYSADSINCIENNSKETIIFGPIKPILSFAGRKKEITTLLEWFNSNDSLAILISGIGGQGKSELCRKFIENITYHSNVRAVTWLAGENFHTLYQSLSKFALSLKLSSTDEEGKRIPIKNLIKNCVNKIGLTINQRWTVVVDNVDDIYEEFIPVIQSLLNYNTFILITSRQVNILTSDNSEYLKLGVSELEENDAVEFVAKFLKSQNKENILKLCQALQNYVLALQQAVAYIKHMQKIQDDGYGITEYLEEFNDHKLNVLHHQLRLSNYENTITKIIEMTILKICNEKNCLILLQIITLLLPDGISSSFLFNLFAICCESPEKKFEFETLLSMLKNLFLLNIQNGNISIHRYIQIISRKELAKKFSLQFDQIIKKIVTKLQIFELSSVDIFHILSLWNYAVSNSPLIIDINENFSPQICRQLFELSFYHRLKEFAEENYKLFVTHYGQENYKKLFKMEYYVAIAFERTGEYEEALTKFTTLWGKQKKHFEVEHDDTIDTGHQVARVLWRLKRLNESMEWNQRILKLRIKVNGENCENTMNTKNNMALVYADQGNLGAALDLHNQVLEWKVKNLEPEHPSTIATRGNIAIVLYKQGKFLEAKTEGERVLALREQALGEEHAETLNLKYNLAVFTHSLGEKEKGMKMSQEVLIGQEKILGDNHPQTQITRNLIRDWQAQLFIDKMNLKML